MRVMIIGASGNLGRRLVRRAAAHGHEVTAFVRDAAAFNALNLSPSSVSLTTVEGDASDDHSLAAAVRGQDAVINTAGNAADGERFVSLFRTILKVVENELPSSGRFWAMAGAAVLTIPFYEGIAVGLPGVPKMYLPHEQNWHALEQSRLDWSLMCPGPMIPAVSDLLRNDLRTSLDVVPYHVPRWAGWAPRIALSLLMKTKLPELIVSYEDVAELMIAHLQPGTPFGRHRVGVALPPGEQGRKENWTLGQRGGDS